MKPLEWTVLSQFSSVTQSCPTSLWPHGLQHARLPCLSPTPWACSNSCSSSRWCHPTIASSIVLSLSPPAFSLSQHQGLFHEFISGSQSIEALASASVLPVNIQGWFALGLTGLISLYSMQIALLGNLNNENYMHILLFWGKSNTITQESLSQALNKHPFHQISDPWRLQLLKNL